MTLPWCPDIDVTCKAVSYQPEEPMMSEFQEAWFKARSVDGIAHRECMHMVRVGDAMLDALAERDAAIAQLVAVLAKAEETLLLGRQFAGINEDEYGFWCGHADLVEQEARALIAKHSKEPKP